MWEGPENDPDRTVQSRNPMPYYLTLYIFPYKAFLLGSFYTCRARIIFGLNALTGRTVGSDGTATGAWNSTNAESLITYTINKGYTIDGWEFGKNSHFTQFTSSFDSEEFPHRAVILAHYQKSFSLSDRKIKRFHICVLFVCFQSLNRYGNFLIIYARECVIFLSENGMTTRD